MSEIQKIGVRFQIFSLIQYSSRLLYISKIVVIKFSMKLFIYNCIERITVLEIFDLKVKKLVF